MDSPINITTLSGVRLDVTPSATIEVNMGGISLLDLNSRTATYTNSFNLPRTKTNETVFEFASQPTRSNRPSIDVLVTKGLFQKKAVLKVIDFDKEYKCSITYDSENLIEQVKLLNIYDFVTDGTVVYTFGSTEPTQEEIVLACNDINNGYFYPVTKPHTFTRNTTSPNNCAISLNKLIDIGGITFSGTLLDVIGNDFDKSFIFMRNIFLSVQNISGTWKLILTKNDTTSKILFSDVIQTISYIFFADVVYNENRIELNSFTTDFTQIDLEGFTFKKSLTTPYEKNNYIRYTLVDSSIDVNFGADNISSVGSGDKVLVEIKNKIPKFYTGIYGDYDILNDVSDSDIIIMGYEAELAYMSYNAVDFIEVITAKVAKPLSMIGFYSNILNPIFSEPIFLDAAKNIDPFAANTIMNNRVINSVQLGGKYWVDSMAYNLTTGKSKLTLIKLP